MRETRLLLFCSFLVAAGCSPIDAGGDPDASAGDHRDASGGGGGGGGGGGVADASAPDATPVACDGPEDCASPDDPCQLPGTCEDNVCVFPTKDCSDLDGDCTRGICADDGECVGRPIRQDMACGDGVMDCGAFGACGGFGDTCDESGTQSRSCTDSTCQSGQCVTGAPYSDSRSCDRDTDGVSCGGTAVVCDACGYTTECDNSAPDAACVQFSDVCSLGTCENVQTSAPADDCERNTQGDPCGAQNAGCCTQFGSCSFCQ